LSEQWDLRALLEKHHQASYGWALHCCGRRDAEAEEVLQESYLKVLDGRARYNGNAAFKTWLFAVIRNTAASERRRGWLRHLSLLRFTQNNPDSPTVKSAGREFSEAGITGGAAALSGRLICPATGSSSPNILSRTDNCSGRGSYGYLGWFRKAALRAWQREATASFAASGGSS